MRGFEVTPQDGEALQIEATHYRVGDDGSLVVYLDEFEVVRVAPNEWERVDDFGVLLSQQWPDARLDAVIDGAKSILAVTYGHYIHKVGGSDKYARGFFDDLDSLTAALLASVGLDHAASNHPEIAAVRQHLATAFAVTPASTSIQPSSYMTDLHCPRCGDVLYVNPDPKWTLECLNGAMGLSHKGTELIEEYRNQRPSKATGRTTTVNWGGIWFCPVDGMRMTASPTELPSCQWCERVMEGRLIYHLIEMHVHS